MSTDPHQQVAALIERLTGPGGEFETVTEEVLGAPVQLLKDRPGSLIEVFDAAAEFGDKDHLVTADERITFAEHDARVRLLARHLVDRYGVGKGDRVAILAGNSPGWVQTFWAVQLLGGIAVGFNAWWTAEETDYALGHSRPRLLVTDRKRLGRIGEVDVPIISIEDDLPRLTTPGDDEPAELPAVELDEDDPSTLLYTSGTSGRPKGAVHSHRAMVAVIGYHRFNDRLADAFAGETGTRSADRRYLLTSPLFHIASLHNLIVPRLASGTTVVFAGDRFDADEVLGLIEHERVTNWGAVPTLVKRLMDGPVEDYDLSSMDAFALASAPSSPEFKSLARRRLPFAATTLVDSYGLTESATAVAVATPMDLAAHPETVGRPVFGVQMRICDPLGEELPDGEEGEVCVRSAYVTLGYWEDPSATAAAIDADRWLRTGDLGVLRGGLLYLTSRRSDLIVRGGENVYPVEVEQVLETVPGVRESVVLGDDDEEYGQVPVAVVVTKASEPVTEDELVAHVQDRLAAFKHPVRWRITTEPLPRNATGKVVRREVDLPDQP